MTLEELLSHMKDGNWDWPETDYSWLSSGITRYEHGAHTSIFFIHGGRIRHQAHLPHGYHSVEDFVDLVGKLSAGLDNPRVAWKSDTGDGQCGLWVEGTRLPNQEDVDRLEAARVHQQNVDRRAIADLRRRGVLKNEQV